MGVCPLACHQTFGSKSFFSKFFIFLTTHQVLMFDIRDFGGHVCKKFE
jgi:hypothetical protein